MDRRTLLTMLATLPLVRSAAAAGPVPPGATTPQVEELRNGWRSLLAKDADVAKDTAPLKLSADEWRKRLSPDAYKVLRDEGTERPFTSALNDEKRKGVFVCAGCAWPVFTSAMKYDSGTGWPSFFTTIPGAFGTSSDFRILYTRIEYHCAKCGGHHGHVFDDARGRRSALVQQRSARFAQFSRAGRTRTPAADRRPNAASRILPFGPSPAPRWTTTPASSSPPSARCSRGCAPASP
jgi:peptide-methionine (R)-S-oxide reductase